MYELSPYGALSNESISYPGENLRSFFFLVKSHPTNGGTVSD